MCMHSSMSDIAKLVFPLHPPNIIGPPSQACCIKYTYNSMTVNACTSTASHLSASFVKYLYRYVTCSDGL